MFQKYIIKYSVLGKRMAYECATAEMATYHSTDIAGYEGVTDVVVEPVLAETPEILPSPYETNE